MQLPPQLLLLGSCWRSGAKTRLANFAADAVADYDEGEDAADDNADDDDVFVVAVEAADEAEAAAADLGKGPPK